MLIVINCQNGFVDKADKKVFENIVEAAERVETAWFLTWANPPDAAFLKGTQPVLRPVHEAALHERLLALDQHPIHAMRFPDDIRGKFEEALEGVKEVWIMGIDTEGWLVQIAAELWSRRIKPHFVAGAWTAISTQKHALSDVRLELQRRFGGAAFIDWEKYLPTLPPKPEFTLKSLQTKVEGAEEGEEVPVEGEEPSA